MDRHSTLQPDLCWGLELVFTSLGVLCFGYGKYILITTWTKVEEIRTSMQFLLTSASWEQEHVETPLLLACCKSVFSPPAPKF